MGFIASSTTVYSQAFLTELGRSYVFNSLDKPRYVTLSNGKTIDRLKIERFSLGDSDVNYNLPLNLDSGDIPDLTGENEQCVTGAKGRTLTNIISPGASNIPGTDIETLEYKSTYKQIVFDMVKAANLLPMVTTQQLKTYIDGIFVNDGVYIVTPTNYGPNKLNNNEIIIMIKEPTPITDGYRLRIIFPSTGSNYNKMTFQFEKATVQTGTVVTQVSTVIEPATA